MHIIFLLSDKERTTDVCRMTDMARAMNSRGHLVTVMLPLVPTFDTLAASLSQWGIAVLSYQQGWFKIGESTALLKAVGNSDRIIVVTTNDSDAKTALTVRSNRRKAGCDICVVADYSYRTVSEFDRQHNRRTAAETDAVIVPTERCRHRLIENIAGLNPDKVHVAVPGVPLLDVADSIESPADANEIPAAEPLRVLFAGRLLQGCGLDVILEAMRAAFDVPVTLTVAGQGPGRWAMPLVRMARTLKLQDKIRWLGNDPVPGIRELADAHVAVMPAPGVVDDPLYLEAMYMAASLPVILPKPYRTLGPMLCGIDGLDVDNPASPDSWAEIFRKLHSDRQLLRQMSLSARQKAVAQFDFTDLVNHTEDLYTSLLGNR